MYLSNFLRVFLRVVFRSELKKRNRINICGTLLNL
jgi:hypothetical protein